MALLWFVLGALFVTYVVGLHRWISKNSISLSFLSWLGTFVGGLMLFFTIAWCVTSIHEGEGQAAMMGLLFFGVPAVIILVLTRRKMLYDAR